MKITFLTTGGTIDKDYPKTTNGWGFEIGEPSVTRILKHLNPSFQYQVIQAFRKDSLEITDKDRDFLVQLIREIDSKAIIITHGTDTMIETAQYIAEHLPNAFAEKAIILTGAIRPQRFSNSDAAINIGAAIAAANLLDSGVYLTMHGVVKSYDTIERNMETGQFY